MKPEEIIAREINRYYARIWGAPHIYGVADSRGPWNAEPVEHGMAEYQAFQRAREMNAANIVAALEAAGFVIVPVEPTQEMDTAGDFASCSHVACECDSSTIYRAMLTTHREGEGK